MASHFDDRTETPEFENIAKLAENLVYRLPGCSDLTILKTVREVYREFVRRSCCLRTTRRIFLEKGVRRYPVEPVYGEVVRSVVRVESDLTRREMRQHDDYEVVDGKPVCIVLRRFWVPFNLDHGSVTVTADEMPSMESDRIPKWFVDQHGDAVCSGVMARLTAVANKPWSDPQSSAQYRIAYENAIGEARLTSYGGSQFGNPPGDNPLAAELV